MGLFVALLLLLSVIYTKIILLNPILNYDDKYITEPLKSVINFSGYIESIKNGQIPDVQPVRDFIYLASLKLQPWFPLFNYHFVNVLFWFATCLFIYSIFSYFTKRNLTSAFFTLLIAISPLATSSIAWVAAQKHILSTFFTLMATAFVLNTKEENLNFKNSILISLVYTLAIFAHPINLLWPYWVFLFFHIKKYPLKKNIIFLLPSLLCSLIGYAVNAIYYDTIYVQANGGLSKYDPQLANDFGVRFLALGRYFFVTLFPFDTLPSSHYIGSTQNLIGLILFVCLCSAVYLYVKKSKDYLPALFILYFLYPIFPVTFKMTRIFCSDTYILNASIGIYLLMAYFSNQVKRIKINVLISLYALALFIFNLTYVKNFYSDFNIWHYSYSKEATPNSALALAEIYLSQGNYEQSDLLIRRVHDWEQDSVLLYGMAAKNIFYNSHFPIEYKIKRLSNFKPQRPITSFFLAILYTNIGLKKEAREQLEKVLINPNYFVLDLMNQKDKVMGTYLAMCELNELSSCQQSFDRFKIYFMDGAWDLDKIKSTQKKILEAKRVSNYDHYLDI